MSKVELLHQVLKNASKEVASWPEWRRSDETREQLRKLNTWSVYIVRCADDTFYTGISTDIERRIRQHNAGKGAKYTRGRGPVKLCCQRNQLTQSQALKLEARVKRARRDEKCNVLLMSGV